MNDAAGRCTSVGVLVVTIALFAYSPDVAFWVLFGLLALASPFIVVVGAIRWIVKHKGETPHAKKISW